MTAEAAADIDDSIKRKRIRVSLKEVDKAIWMPQNCKSPGVDNIPAEIVKYGRPGVVDALTVICQKTWLKGTVVDHSFSEERHHATLPEPLIFGYISNAADPVPELRPCRNRDTKRCFGTVGPM